MGVLDCRGCLLHSSMTLFDVSIAEVFSYRFCLAYDVCGANSPRVRNEPRQCPNILWIWGLLLEQHINWDSPAFQDCDRQTPLSLPNPEKHNPHLTQNTLKAAMEITPVAAESGCLDSCSRNADRRFSKPLSLPQFLHTGNSHYCQPC